MNWKDYITEAEQILGETAEDMLEEKMVKKYHVEHGQKKVKWVTDKPGYRIEYDQNHMPREVKIRTTEKINRRKGAKIGSLKHNKKREQALSVKSPSCPENAWVWITIRRLRSLTPGARKDRPLNPM